MSRAGDAAGGYGWLPLGAWLLWAAGGLLGQQVGLWYALGSVALLLGAGILTCAWPHYRQELRPDTWVVAIGVLAGGVMSAATYLLVPVLLSWWPALDPWIDDLYARFRRPPSWSSFLLLPFIVLGENLIWRGIIQDHAVARLGPRLGLLLGVGAYAFAEVPTGSPLLPVCGLAVGFYLSLLKVWTGSLVPTMVAHLIWDTAILYLWPLGGAG